VTDVLDDPAEDGLKRCFITTLEGGAHGRSVAQSGKESEHVGVVEFLHLVSSCSMYSICAAKTYSSSENHIDGQSIFAIP
jgi:hypothetical protein